MVRTSEPGNEGVHVAELAEQMYAEVEHLDCLRAVGYYSPREHDTVYLREGSEREVVGKDDLLEDAVLESISLQTVEDYVEDELRSMIRVFETKVILYACPAGRRGIVVSVDWDPLIDYRALLRTLEDVIDTSG